MSAVPIRAICVFCGSSAGADPRFAEAARQTGRLLAAGGVTLVYGGAHRGLMGIMADAALAAGGRVVGVIPESLVAREVAHQGLSELHVVPSMHARKALMADRSDAFLILPGGLGTLDEWFEIWTWAAMGLHAKPIGAVNVAGYFDPLLAFLARATGAGLIGEPHLARTVVAAGVGDVLRMIGAPAGGDGPPAA